MFVCRSYWLRIRAFLESFTGGGIYGNFFGLATWAHEYMAIVVNIDGHIARRGVLKELEICDFEKKIVSMSTR